MNLKFWSHKNGFRSPTEQQLARWEVDGGNYTDCQNCILVDGRLYSGQVDLLKARARNQLKQAVVFLQNRLEARSGDHPSAI